MYKVKDHNSVKNSILNNFLGFLWSYSRLIGKSVKCGKSVKERYIKHVTGTTKNNLIGYLVTGY